MLNFFCDSISKMHESPFPKKTKYFNKTLKLETSQMVASKYEVSNLGSTSRKMYTSNKKCFQYEVIDLKSIQLNLRKMSKSEKDTNRHNMSTKIVKTNIKGKL